MSDARPTTSPAKPPAETRVLFIGDSPRITSGFGGCNRMACDALIAAGYDLWVHGWLDAKFRPNDPYKIWPVSQYDPLGQQDMMHVVSTLEPDVIVLHADPGTAHDRLQLLHIFASTIPVVVWFPIEGLPLNPNFVELAHQLGSMPWRAGLTYTNMGADACKVHAGYRPGVQTLGWDHAPFHPLPDEVRTHLRKATGLDPWFVAMNVAYNKRTNRHPAILRAAALAGKQELPILYYLHTNAHEQPGLQGCDLDHLRKHYGADHAIMKDDRRKTYEGVQYSDNTPDEDYLKVALSEDKDVQRALFHSLPLGIKYALADLYIDPSSVQGYNLPSVEAAACGLPLITVNDGAARSDVFKTLAAGWFEPDGIDQWQTGAELKLVSSDQIHFIVRRFHLQSLLAPDAYKEMGRRARTLVEQEFRWNMTPLLDAVAGVLAAEKPQQSTMFVKQA